MKQILTFILLVSVFAASAQVSTRCPVCPPKQGAANDSSCLKIVNGVAVWLPCASGSGQWTTSGNNIYNSNSGNVGIGITAPSLKLEVVGRFGAYYLNGVEEQEHIYLFDSYVEMQASSAALAKLARVRVDTLGNIYIDGDLEIAPTLKYIDGNQSNGDVLTSDADGNATWQSPANGTSPPATTPIYVGQLFIDTSAKKLYFATGTSSSADWTIAN